MRAGITLSALTSSWLPFLVHAIAQLKRGGRLAMVLPFELTHAWMLALAVALFLSCSTFPAVGQDNAVDSLKALRARADHGDAEAQVIIGVLYAKGQGVAQDYAEALRWFRKAADQGLAEAQFNLGFMYDKGRGLPAPSRSPRAPTTRTTCPPSNRVKAEIKGSDPTDNSRAPGSRLYLRVDLHPAHQVQPHRQGPLHTCRAAHYGCLRRGQISDHAGLREVPYSR